MLQRDCDARTMAYELQSLAVINGGHSQNACEIVPALKAQNLIHDTHDPEVLGHVEGALLESYPNDETQPFFLLTFKDTTESMTCPDWNLMIHCRH